MLERLATYFRETDFMPHGHCYRWEPALVWTHVTTDMLIGLAYVSISLSLYGLLRRIRVPFSAMVLSFGVFIAACGATHFMEVWNLWHGEYWWGGLVKLVTAVASVSTAIWLFRLRPEIIAVAESAKLSEQRRHQLAEQQKLLAHTAKMSALGEMAGGIAHEINSPLGIITVRANQIERLLQRGTATPEALAHEARLIVATAKRIGEIIKGLRTFAREGDTDPFEPVNVAALLRDALFLCQARFKNHNIDLRVGAVDEALTVDCRPVQIGQVVLNLLSNAFDAVASLPEKWANVDVIEDGEYVEIAITDSGLGIAPEVRDKLMQPFFTTKEVGKGTGLGLSISRGILEAHYGSLRLDTSSAHTRFVLRLPKKHSGKGTT